MAAPTRNYDLIKKYQLFLDFLVLFIIILKKLLMVESDFFFYVEYIYGFVMLGGL